NKIYPKEVGKHPIRVNCREGELGERRASFSVNGGETDIEEEDSQFDFNQYYSLVGFRGWNAGRWLGRRRFDVGRASNR
ncbi:MAG: hypothetical protein WBJ56_01365, partial [Dethiobacteria bacterium]